MTVKMERYLNEFHLETRAFSLMLDLISSKSGDTRGAVVVRIGTDALRE